MRKYLIQLLILSTVFIFTDDVSASRDSRENYEKTGNVIWEVKTVKKLVALTFDDGPHPTFTPHILDILAKYDAKATFFVSGNKVERFPEVLKRTANEGHEIANHTYSHIYSGRITAEKLTEELEKTDTIIEKLTGQKPTLYRPVGGLYNNNIINTAVKNGKRVVLWSWNQDPHDWRNPPASDISAYIKKGLSPGDIILLHDWHGSEYTTVSQTVKALEDVLSHFQQNGYKCVTVSEMLYHSSETVPDIVEPFK